MRRRTVVIQAAIHIVAALGSSQALCFPLILLWQLFEIQRWAVLVPGRSSEA
jgi:hypothetical protein